MKKFVLAPDSFKESMTAKEVCVAMEKGIKKVFSDAEIIHVPMADGGEGTVESLVSLTNGEIVTIDVKDPLSREIKGFYGLTRENIKKRKNTSYFYKKILFLLKKRLILQLIFSRRFK